MPKKLIDSSPFREREGPLPFWYANWCLKDGKEDAATAADVMNDWREAFDIAQRLMTLKYSDAVAEFHMLPDPRMLMMVRARWNALRYQPIDWVVDD